MTLFQIGIKKQDDVETHSDANNKEGKNIDGFREEDSLCGNEI